MLAFRPPNHEQAPCIIIHEAVREAFGQHHTDRRRSKTELQQILSQWEATSSFRVQFDGAFAEHDDLWTPHQRETLSNVQARVHAFLHWLAQRPELNIAVVTHGVWMEVLLQQFLTTRVYNCHAYATEVVSRPSGNGGVLVYLQNVSQLSTE